MKQQTLAKLILACLLPISLMANPVLKSAKHEEEKTITKEFEVSADALVKIDNSYGNLNVLTWDKNEVYIQVHITTKGDDLEAVKRKLDEINVHFSATRHMVSAETVFGDDDDGWWDNFFESNSVSFTIDYLVKIPKTNAVDLENDYGNIMLDDLEGRATISCDYGKITTKALMASHNEIEFDYSDHCYFEYINGGTIEADYSGFTIDKAKDLEINADYTDGEIGVAESIHFDNDYGSLSVGKVNDFIGAADYQDLHVGQVYKNVNLDLGYGDLYIEKMMATAGNIHIDARYSEIEIGVAPDYAFDFTVELSYADLRAPETFHFTTRMDEDYFEGYHGAEGSGNKVYIESSYGDVAFYRKP